MKDFKEFGLPAELVAALERMKFTTPTPIQAQAIPLALQGKDILGSAQTGTGKTAAFAIPLITRLLSSPRGSALVMSPTRELAGQIMDAMQQMLGKNSMIRTALLIGGESMPKQFAQLKMRPRLIVGTPGRINDHLSRGSLGLHDAGMLVLDETDRMLDMGFGIQIDKILKYVPQTRQTLLFSATLPANIVKLSEKYLKNPERISVGSTTTPIAKIRQEVIRTSEADKYSELLRQLDARQGSVIVFVKTKWGAEKLAVKLCKQKYSADAIHGDLQQRRREKVIQAFRDKRHRVMVATDIASRGLDIPHIEHVINYNLPQCPEDYIHRIGRTARAGAEGSAICLVSPEDEGKWRAIQRLMDPNTKDNGPRPNNGGHDSRRRRGGGKSGNKKWFKFRGQRRGGDNTRAAA